MYDAFYKLKAKPFQLSPDPRCFFNSQGHKRALAYLRYGIRQGEGFIIITGEIGTGKTLLARTLFNDLKKENVVAGQLVTTQVDPEDTLRMVASSFGLVHEDVPKATLIKNLEKFLRARHQEGKRVVLLVDEVQNLPIRSIEELRMLSNFEAGGRSLLQSFLLGQAEFRVTLQSAAMEQLRQRVIAAYHLSPFNAEETRSYIEYRLEIAGWKSDPLITDDAYTEIHKASGGVPRRINGLCDRLLLYGYLEELHKFDAETIKLVAKEMIEETRKGTPPVQNVAAVAPPPGNANVGQQTVTVTPDGSVPIGVENRISELESAVESLRCIIQKERVLLRKALLISLDLDEESNAIQDPVGPNVANG